MYGAQTNLLNISSDSQPSSEIISPVEQKIPEISKLRLEDNRKSWDGP